MAKVCVLGSGSWGTAIVVHLANKGEDVVLCSLTDDKFNSIKKDRENQTALPGVKIPDSVVITKDVEASVKDAELLVLATASLYVRETAKKIAPFVKDGQIIAEAAKGIEEDRLQMLYEVVEEEIPQAKVAVISGPTHAEEVGRGIPTTCVVGARQKDTAEYIRNVFFSDSFRVYINPDMLGIALGGALKNVIALAAGIADGLGYGDNSKAALIIAFSPIEIAGDTSTAPYLAAQRHSLILAFSSSSLILLGHCTCSFNGLWSKNRFPIAEKLIPANTSPLCTLKRSGFSRFIISRRGLSFR